VWVGEIVSCWKNRELSFYSAT